MKDYIIELNRERQVIATASEKGKWIALKNIDNLGYLSVSQMKEFFKWILDFPKDGQFVISFPIYFPLDAWGLYDDCFWKNMDEKVDTLCEFIRSLSGPFIMLKLNTLPREPRHVLQARTASLFHGVALDSKEYEKTKMDYSEQDAKALLYARISRCLMVD